MLPVQCRMARAALGLGVRELAEMADVSPDTVARLERGEDLKPRTVEAVRSALEAAGVIFVEENGDGPGVRLRRSKMPIYVDASQPASTHHAGKVESYLTLQEAVFAWHRLPPALQQTTFIQVDGANSEVYKEGDIRRLHYAAKLAGSATDAVEAMDAAIKGDRVKRKPKS